KTGDGTNFVAVLPHLTHLGIPPRSPCSSDNVHHLHRLCASRPEGAGPSGRAASSMEEGGRARRPTNGGPCDHATGPGTSDARSISSALHHPRRASTRRSTSMPSNWTCGRMDRLQWYHPILPSTGVTLSEYALKG